MIDSFCKPSEPKRMKLTWNISIHNVYTFRVHSVSAEGCECFGNENFCINYIHEMGRIIPKKLNDENIFNSSSDLIIFGKLFAGCVENTLEGIDIYVDNG